MSLYVSSRLQSLTVLVSQCLITVSAVLFNVRTRLMSLPAPQSKCRSLLEIGRQRPSQPGSHCKGSTHSAYTLLTSNSSLSSSPPRSKVDSSSSSSVRPPSPSPSLSSSDSSSFQVLSPSSLLFSPLVDSPIATRLKTWATRYKIPRMVPSLFSTLSPSSSGASSSIDLELGVQMVALPLLVS